MINEEATRKIVNSFGLSANNFIEHLPTHIIHIFKIVRFHVLDFFKFINIVWSLAKIWHL